VYGRKVLQVTLLLSGLSWISPERQNRISCGIQAWIKKSSNNQGCEGRHPTVFSVFWVHIPSECSRNLLFFYCMKYSNRQNLQAIVECFHTQIPILKPKYFFLRSGRDESIRVVIHVCIEAMLGISLYSYPYLN
jgi:hypothetical protein